MGILLEYQTEPCPRCGSEDHRLWHSHRCQAFFVICNQCEHEDGRERTETEAVSTWNREARSSAGKGSIVIEQECPSYPVSIFIAGGVSEAETVCREYCDAAGLCVTVTGTHYVYTDGEEAGVIVGLINYPRFPKEPREIEARALALGDLLRERLGQQSYSIQTPERTIWRSWRLP